MDGWMDGAMDGWTRACMPACIGVYSKVRFDSVLLQRLILPTRSRRHEDDDHSHDDCVVVVMLKVLLRRGVMLLTVMYTRAHTCIHDMDIYIFISTPIHIHTGMCVFWQPGSNEVTMLLTHTHTHTYAYNVCINISTCTYICVYYIYNCVSYRQMHQQADGQVVERWMDRHTDGQVDRR